MDNLGIKKLKAAWDENPIGVALAAAALLTGAGKLIDAISGIPSKRAYAKNRKGK